MRHPILATIGVLLACSAIAVACSHKRDQTASATTSPCYIGPAREQPIPVQPSQIRPGIVNAAHIETRTPIKHVVFIMKENRTFDNLFGAFPGANGASTGQLGDKTVSLRSHCFPQALPRDMVHDLPTALASWNKGAMNGFGTNAYTSEWAYTQATEKDIPNYWHWAQDFALSDNFFTSVLGPSFPNHLYSIAGTAFGTHDNPVPPGGIDAGTNRSSPVVAKSWGCDSPRGTYVLVDAGGGKTTQEYPCFELKVLPDLLKAAGVPWAYYGASQTQEGYFWVSPDYVNHIRNVPTTWETHVFGVDQIVPDIQDGRLPPVTWITPHFWESDHPDASLCNGENWTTQVVNTIMTSPMWKDTAIFIAWDDWGGYYDHVAPPDHLGFRTPVLTISPYSKRGYIDSTQGDFSSILKFIEYNWKLPGLRSGDPASGNNMLQNFDFSQTPRGSDVMPIRHDCQDFPNAGQDHADPN